MKISIVMVCLNAQNTIEKTLKSIFSQTYKNIELVIFDGKSSDGTVDIIEKYMDNVSFFHSGEDKGLYDAMNCALKRVTGDWILFFNAGDTFCDDYVLEKTAAEISKNPDCSFVFGYSKDVDENGNCVKINTYDNFDRNYFFLNENICHQAIFYKKELFLNDCYDIKNFKIYADWDFNARCIKIKKVKMHRMDFAVCNFDITGISRNMKYLEIFDREKDLIWRKYFPLIYKFSKIDRFMLKTFKSIYLPLRKLFIK